MNASLTAAAAVAPPGVGPAMRLLSQAVAGLPPPLGHCISLLDRQGMVQFACGAAPDLRYGYCLDDNARAFLVANLVLDLEPDNGDARRLGEASLRFAERCRRADGSFHNLMRADGSFSDDVGSQDSLGRLIWACSVALSVSRVPSVDWRSRAGNLLSSALEHVESLTDLRPKSYAILGLAALASALGPVSGDGMAPPHGDGITPRGEGIADASRTHDLLVRLCDSLARALDRSARDDWFWFEPELSWGNARLAEALLRGGAALGDQTLRARGLQALRFLSSVTHHSDVFVPIGNRGWFPRGATRAIYDQQPIEAATMVDAYLAAARLTDPLEYESKALEALAWFLGLNTRALNLVDPRSGGCHDGLAADSMNANMGAESTLSYVHAHATLAAHFRRTT